MSQHHLDLISELQETMSQNLGTAWELAESNVKSFLSPRPLVCHDPYKGITPYEVVFRLDRMRVLRYAKPGVEPVAGAVPILLVPSLINRSYVMDLMEGSSLTDHLFKSGVPTYLIDWGTPGPQHDHLSFRTYVDDLIGMATSAVRRDSGVDRIALLGYCMGGTMALLHLALRPEYIDRLTMLAAPVNFHDDSVLSHWAREEAFDVDHLIDTLGSMDSRMLQSSFLMIKPLSVIQKYVSLYRQSRNQKVRDSFINLERWLNDNVAVPGEAYRDYVKLCYQENALIKGVFDWDGQTIDLKEIQAPILNVMARKDHLVPMASSEILADLVGGPIEPVIIDAGHIGIAMGSKARQMFARVADFHLPQSQSTTS